jgi:hypothetical protein
MIRNRCHKFHIRTSALRDNPCMAANAPLHSPLLVKQQRHFDVSGSMPVSVVTSVDAACGWVRVDCAR